MCVFPASHLKVHATIEKRLADEQTVLRISFALGGVFFLQLHGLAMRTLWHDRQCCQGVEI
jgi:hypothetical protein